MLRRTLLTALLALGCGGESPANVAGTYTLALTVEQTGCGIVGGAVGDTSSGVQVIITQSGGDVTCQVQGVAGLALALAMGSDTFAGKMAGNSLDASIAGTTPGSSGTCAYTRNARLQAKLSGDTLTGSVTYTYATNQTADCDGKNSCKDVQAFNGTRPPKV